MVKTAKTDIFCAIGVLPISGQDRYNMDDKI